VACDGRMDEQLDFHMKINYSLVDIEMFHIIVCYNRQELLLIEN